MDKRLMDLIKELNEVELNLKEEIEGAIEYYGECTDDAEMYIGRLKEEASKEIEMLLYEDLEDEVFFNGEVWALR